MISLSSDFLLPLCGADVTAVRAAIESQLPGLTVIGCCKGVSVLCGLFDNCPVSHLDFPYRQFVFK